MPRKKSSRKPGAQPGNKNAISHGFYQHILTPQEQTLQDEDIDFLSEQKYNRALIRRVGRHLKFDSLDPAQLIAWGLTIKSFLALCSLERIRILKFGQGGELGRTILETLKEMNPDEDL